MDRPHRQPDVPDEIGPAKDLPPAKAEVFPNLEHQTNEAAAAFLGLDRQDRRLPELLGKDESLADAGVRGMPRWKVTDPIELPDIVVRKDIGPGINPPDYRNPAAKDTLKLEHGQEVIVGKHGSPDNPRRVAEVRHDQIIDKESDEPPPEDPSGEELRDVLDDDDKSTYNRIRDKASSPEFVEGLQDTGKNLGGTTWQVLEDRPKPTGSYTATPDHPVVTAQQQGSPDVGLVATLPLIAWIGFDRTVRFVRDQVNELKSRGDQRDGDS